MQTKIHIERLAINARHGVLPQERTIGAVFYVSLYATIDADTAALEHDDLVGTVDYAALCHSIRAEMQQPSALLEHVAHRIARRLLHEQPRILSLRLRIDKQMPPTGMCADAIGVEIEMSADD